MHGGAQKYLKHSEMRLFQKFNIMKLFSAQVSFLSLFFSQIIFIEIRNTRANVHSPVTTICFSWKFVPSDYYRVSLPSDSEIASRL